MFSMHSGLREFNFYFNNLSTRNLDKRNPLLQGDVSWEHVDVWKKLSYLQVAICQYKKIKQHHRNLVHWLQRTIKEIMCVFVSFNVKSMLFLLFLLFILMCMSMFVCFFAYIHISTACFKMTNDIYLPYCLNK